MSRKVRRVSMRASLVVWVVWVGVAVCQVSQREGEGAVVIA